MKGCLLAGLCPISVSFPITLAQRNTQVRQVIMNAASDAWPFSLPPAHLVCPHCCFVSPVLTPLTLQCFLFFFFPPLHQQKCFHFRRFNCPPVCFAPCFVVQMHKPGKVFISVLFFFFWINWTVVYIRRQCRVCMNEKKRETLLIRSFPLASTVHTGGDELIKFSAQQPPLHSRLQQKGL